MFYIFLVFFALLRSNTGPIELKLIYSESSWNSASDKHMISKSPKVKKCRYFLKLSLWIGSSVGNGISFAIFLKKRRPNRTKRESKLLGRDVDEALWDWDPKSSTVDASRSIPGLNDTFLTLVSLITTLELAIQLMALKIPQKTKSYGQTLNGITSVSNRLLD